MSPFTTDMVPVEQQQTRLPCIAVETGGDAVLDRITDDLKFLLSEATEDVRTFPGQQQGRSKLATIQENMVGACEETETR